MLMGEIIKTKVKGCYTLEEIKEKITYDEMIKGDDE